MQDGGQRERGARMHEGRSEGHEVCGERVCVTYLFKKMMTTESRLDLAETVAD